MTISKIAILFCWGVFFCGVLHAQTIEIVGVEQEGQRIKITYNLSGSKGIYAIKLFVKEADSSDWGSELLSVSGDVGENQKLGIRKVIFWDVLSNRSSFVGDYVFGIQAVNVTQSIQNEKDLEKKRLEEKKRKEKLANEEQRIRENNEKKIASWKKKELRKKKWSNYWNKYTYRALVYQYDKESLWNIRYYQDNFYLGAKMKFTKPFGIVAMYRRDENGNILKNIDDSQSGYNWGPVIEKTHGNFFVIGGLNTNISEMFSAGIGGGLGWERHLELRNDNDYYDPKDSWIRDVEKTKFRSFFEANLLLKVKSRVIGSFGWRYDGDNSFLFGLGYCF